MRSLLDIAAFDAKEKKKDVAIGWYLVSFMMPLPSLLFGMSMVKNSGGFMGVPPEFFLFFSLSVISSVLGVLAVGIGYCYHRNGCALAWLVILNLLASPFHLFIWPLISWVSKD